MTENLTSGKSMKKLVLIDAYSLLFRAYFAGRPLTTSDGRQTGALYGFTNMLFHVLNNAKPDSIVVCWDAHAPTIRSQEFEAYKAHRPSTDQQLREQMPVARKLVEAMSIQSEELAGYEADDLIGTLAKRGAEQGFNVTILTGDSDQLQLVGERVTVEITQRGVTETKPYTADTVMERYGIGPERIPDWKALVGDTSDNIPGVPGIGDKTATALLQKWGSLDGILANVEVVTPAKAKTALMEGVEQAKFSRRLATIDCNVPITDPIRPYAPTEEDWERTRAFFLDLEFKTLLTRIPTTTLSTALLSPEKSFSAKTIHIQSETQLKEALESMRRSGTAAIRLQTDTSSAMNAQWLGISFASSPDTGYYVSIRSEIAQQVTGFMTGLFDEPMANDSDALDGKYAAEIENFRAILESENIRKVGHDVKMTEIVLERYGLKPTPFNFDTMIAAYLLDANKSSYSLADLAETHLHCKLEAADSFADEEKLAQEAALIFALIEPLKAALETLDSSDVMQNVDMPLIPVLAGIEEAGLLLDSVYLNHLSFEMAAKMKTLEKEIYALAGEEFNIGSPKQMQTILFDKLQLPTGKKTKTGFSTGADLLEQLAPKYEICREILDWREVSKLKSTYADALPKLINSRTGRIHTSLNQTVASTGRLSSSDPNLQNIPIRSELGRGIRRAFIAPKGKTLLSCDYSQIELRLLAHITRDPALVEAFTKDEDVHAATASTVFGVPLDDVTSDQRRQAKTINFAVIYGQGGFSLASTLGVDTSTANQWIKDYFARLPGVKKYIDDTTALAHEQKYVTTIMGRRRYLPEIDSANHSMRQFAERAAVNMPIQGSAADIMKLAMIQVHDYLKNQKEYDCTLLLQVHDELLFEIAETDLKAVTPLIVHIMESAFPMDIRLKTDAKSGPNWNDMKPVGIS